MVMSNTREIIARIIDPLAWRDLDDPSPTERRDLEALVRIRRNESLAKADAVVSLPVLTGLVEALEGTVRAIDYIDACALSENRAALIADASVRLTREVNNAIAALSEWRKA
jgi:hypothetical protein